MSEKGTNKTLLVIGELLLIVVIGSYIFSTGDGADGGIQKSRLKGCHKLGK